MDNKKKYQLLNDLYNNIHFKVTSEFEYHWLEDEPYCGFSPELEITGGGEFAIYYGDTFLMSMWCYGSQDDFVDNPENIVAVYAEEVVANLHDFFGIIVDGETFASVKDFGKKFVEYVFAGFEDYEIVYSELSSDEALIPDKWFKEYFGLEF